MYYGSYCKAILKFSEKLDLSVHPESLMYFCLFFFFK